MYSQACACVLGAHKARKQERGHDWGHKRPEKRQGMGISAGSPALRPCGASGTEKGERSDSCRQPLPLTTSAKFVTLLRDFVERQMKWYRITADGRERRGLHIRAQAPHVHVSITNKRQTPSRAEPTARAAQVCRNAKSSSSGGRGAPMVRKTACSAQQRADRRRLITLLLLLQDKPAAIIAMIAAPVLGVLYHQSTKT